MPAGRLSIPAAVLGAWLAGSSILARRGQVRWGSLVGGQRAVAVAADGEKAAADDRVPAIVERLDDPRLSSLRRRGRFVAKSRRAAPPRR